jgi:hypothetical protein
VLPDKYARTQIKSNCHFMRFKNIFKSLFYLFRYGLSFWVFLVSIHCWMLWDTGVNFELKATWIREKDLGFVRKIGIYFFHGEEMTMLCRVEPTPMTWNVQTVETFDQSLCSDSLLMQKPASCIYNCFLYS